MMAQMAARIFKSPEPSSTLIGLVLGSDHPAKSIPHADIIQTMQVNRIPINTLDIGFILFLSVTL